MASLPSLPPLTGDTSWIDNPTGMEGLPIPIAPARPSTSTSSTSTIDPFAASRAANLGVDTSGNPNVGAIPPLTGAGTYISQITTWIMSHLEDFVFILIGIILIGAAVFSFKGTQTVIKTAGKAAAEVAA
jgi:hypothetical protein